MWKQITVIYKLKHQWRLCLTTLFHHGFSFRVLSDRLFPRILRNSLITDRNGSDKLLFLPVPSRRRGTLAAASLLGNTRCRAIVGGRLLQLDAAPDGVQHVFSLRDVPRAEVSGVELLLTRGCQAAHAVPLAFLPLALGNRRPLLVGSAQFLAWRRGVDRRLSAPWGGGHAGDALPAVSCCWGLRTLLGTLFSPSEDARQPPRDIGDGRCFDGDHRRLDGDRTRPYGATSDGRFGGGGPPDGGDAGGDDDRSERGWQTCSGSGTLGLKHSAIGLTNVAVSWDGGRFVKLLLFCLLVTTHREIIIIWNWCQMTQLETNWRRLLSHVTYSECVMRYVCLHITKPGGQHQWRQVSPLWGRSLKHGDQDSHTAWLRPGTLNLQPAHIPQDREQELYTFSTFSKRN